MAKLSQDWFPLLELLAMATNPHCKFHIYNGTRPSETVPAGAQLTDDELYARPPDPRSPKVNAPAPNPSRQKSWLVVFIGCDSLKGLETSLVVFALHSESRQPSRLE